MSSEKDSMGALRWPVLALLCLVCLTLARDGWRALSDLRASIRSPGADLLNYLGIFPVLGYGLALLVLLGFGTWLLRSRRPRRRTGEGGK
ncbi:hypothetical protein C8263_04055 [Deinococcus arcticus]|uniref:Uncharacterized protein n=1 Tax=Deinococcus arcticus TaxID=2136176 RepID=A0A2T3WAP8_9DEIO|nr:hypothetical protein C8263_04055 [Deinococcus arcticus]